MKQKKLAHKAARLGVSAKDFDVIRRHVIEAEQHTSGEIAVAMTGESSRYAFYEFFYAVMCGIILFGILLAFSAPLSNWINNMFWYPHPGAFAAFAGLCSLVVILICVFITNIPAIDRFIVPKAVRNRCVYERALRYFVESGVYKTVDHNGVLIFISLTERWVIVLADTGISEVIDASQWNSVCEIILRGLKGKCTAAALCDALRECGDLLAKYFPAKSENPDELPDGLVLLSE